MAAEVDVACNAGYGEVTPERINSRNGYRPGLSIPGWDPSSWPSRSCVRAATTRAGCWSPAGGPSGRWWQWWPECYVRGVSTRRVEGLMQTLGIENLSKSQVSRMAAERLAHQRLHQRPGRGPELADQEDRTRGRWVPILRQLPAPHPARHRRLQLGPPRHPTPRRREAPVSRR